jgi:NADPH2:quinone reductase
MKALVFREKGKAEDVLRLVEVTLAPPEPNEVVVKTIASAINPNDFMFVEKQYRLMPIFPQIAGFEGCGILVDHNGNHEIPVGSLVSFRHKNVWGEYVHVPKEN